MRKRYLGEKKREREQSSPLSVNSLDHRGLWLLKPLPRNSALFIFKCSKLICQAIQVGSPPPPTTLTLRLLTFRRRSAYRSRGVVLPSVMFSAPPLFFKLSLIYLFWIIAKKRERDTLQRAEGSAANVLHPAHISSTRLQGPPGPVSVSQRQGKIHPNKTGLPNQVTVANPETRRF